MEIALVFPGCHRRGGVERIVYEAARHYSLEHNVTVYAQEFEEGGLESVRKRIIPTRTVPRALRLAAFSRDVRSALDGDSHDRVVSFGVCNIDAEVLWVSSVHAAWLEHRDVVATDRLRSSPLRRYLPRHQVLLSMERRYFTRPTATRSITVSERVAEDIERLYGFPRERSVVVHNGFDPSEFDPVASRAAREDARRELGLPHDSVVLLLVANELARKGLSVLLEALGELADERVHLLLVGRADPAAYRGRAAQLGVADRFHYAGSRGDMSRIHGASDVFVLPTRYEAFCLAIVEALASGLPVITTDIPGARDLVVDRVNGRLQRDPASATELVAILREALSGDRFREWAREAAGSVRDHSWARQFARALPVIEGASS